MASKIVSVGISNSDRISTLQDDLLCHTLSFLPTKYSVRTKILSTRWKQLFTFVPNLDFEYNLHPTQDSKANIISFVKFVESFFVSYNLSRINKFRFHIPKSRHPPDNFPLLSWISTAIRFHVKEIDIRVVFPVFLDVPLDLFSCKTLTFLSLKGRLNIVLPHSASFPCLRTCVFKCVCFGDKSAQKLFRSCPVLETLYLTFCSTREDGEVLDISVPTLKRLIFHGKIPQFMLDVPNLVYIEYTGKLSTKLLGLGSLKSVVDAHLLFDDPDAYILELVHSVYHIQRLYLNDDLVQYFLDSGVALPIFKNMTRLRFGLRYGLITRSSLRLLLHFLENTPRLEFLSIEGDRWGEYEEEYTKNNVLSELVPACVNLHLKEVDFKEFRGLDFEFDLVKYFLKHANNLKVMKIQTGEKCDEQFEVSSAACQIVYYPFELD